MSATNRFGNRILLALIGLVAIAAGAWILLRAYPAVLTTVAVPDVPAPDTTALWIVVVAAAAAIVLALAWMFTRGGGRDARVVRHTASDGGTEFDTAVAADLLSASLERQPDIVSVRVTGYRVRRAPALHVTVDTRAGADLPRVRDDVATAVARLDALLERRIPVLLHVTSGVRARFAREQRVT